MLKDRVSEMILFFLILENGSRSGTGSRRSIGDPTANSSRRKSENFGRYERRLCSKLVEELLAADDAEPFLLPVDTRVVRSSINFVSRFKSFSIC